MKEDIRLHQFKSTLEQILYTVKDVKNIQEVDEERVRIILKFLDEFKEYICEGRR